jgi:hypothetical protein
LPQKSPDYGKANSGENQVPAREKAERVSQEPEQWKRPDTAKPVFLRYHPLFFAF